MFCISAWKLCFFAARFSSLAAPPLSSGFFRPFATGVGAPNDDAVAPLLPAVAPLLPRPRREAVEMWR